MSRCPAWYPSQTNLSTKHAERDAVLIVAWDAPVYRHGDLLSGLLVIASGIGDCLLGSLSVGELFSILEVPVNSGPLASGISGSFRGDSTGLGVSVLLWEALWLTGSARRFA